MALVMAVCCSKVETPPSTDPGGQGQEGEQNPSVSVGFDYSLMGDHPRLLLRMEDFDRMQSAIESDSRLSIVHEHILDRSEYLLSEAPLTYKKEGKRLLNVSRAAL